MRWWLVVWMCGCFAGILSAETFVEPIQYLNETSAQAMSALPGAQLYRINMTDASDPACPDPGWDYEYFAPSKASNGTAGWKKITVTLSEQSQKGSCSMIWSQHSDDTDTPIFGTLPLEAALQAPHLTLADAFNIMQSHFFHPLTLKSGEIVKSDVDHGPIFTYILFGEVCGQPTDMSIDAGTGVVVDAPQPPSCPDGIRAN